MKGPWRILRVDSVARIRDFNISQFIYSDKYQCCRLVASDQHGFNFVSRSNIRGIVVLSVKLLLVYLSETASHL